MTQSALCFHLPSRWLGKPTLGILFEASSHFRSVKTDPVPDPSTPCACAYLRASTSQIRSMPTESEQVRLVAFHSIGRLLFHSWIPATSPASRGSCVRILRGACAGGAFRTECRPEEYDELDQPQLHTSIGCKTTQTSSTGASLEMRLENILSSPGDRQDPSKESAMTPGQGSGLVVARCAEQALLRLSHSPRAGA